MQNKKTVIIGVSIFLLVVVAVIVGMIIYNSANKTIITSAYEDCIKTANANIAISKDVNELVDADIKKCTREFIKSQGYNDDIDCVGNANNNPICNEEKYDANGVNIGRYNAEVNGSNQCEETRNDKTNTLLKEKGFKEGVSIFECAKYLSK